MNILWSEYIVWRFLQKIESNAFKKNGRFHLFIWTTHIWSKNIRMAKLKKNQKQKRTKVS